VKSFIDNLVNKLKNILEKVIKRRWEKRIEKNFVETADAKLNQKLFILQDVKIVIKNKIENELGKYKN